MEPASDLELLCLSDHSKLLDDTINLLNAEWPRSRNARLRSLQQCSKDNQFPISLILVKKTKHKNIVIAHSRVLPVPYKPEACFVESVVVDKSLRGKGYGKLIMSKTEEYVLKNGVKIIYLTTHDKQEFYQRLGYEFCDPIVICEGASDAIRQKMECLKLDSDSTTTLKSSPCKETHAINSRNDINISQKTSAPPPPPPPMPVQIIGSQYINSDLKMHMRKILQRN